MTKTILLGLQVWGGLKSSEMCMCSGVCENEATPHCEVGNAPCDTSPPPNPAGKAYGTCTPSDCECLISWLYNGTAHSGCDGAYDQYGYTWCSVDQSCSSAVQGKDPSNSAAYYAVYCTMPTSYKYVKCIGDSNPSVECKCKDTCTDGVCEVLSPPCKMVPTPSPGSKGYMTCNASTVPVRVYALVGTRRGSV
eukprot:TRINITY_DN754_c7_g1_i1.p1 TRINITY_DN754_c7_g1~~TRINITY_DN754_c7_g1_i1.p1  ORF type:complete len:193 (+),score=33.10 TRINITY_DN754_c7_g1_i1:806-1384(+)